MLAALAIAPGPAQARLDTPALSVSRSGIFRIDLEVRAGLSGAPGGFEVQWMTQTDYALRGGWPTDPSDPALFRSSFTGVPTLNVEATSPDFSLAGDAQMGIQMGDLFDETGVAATYADGLNPGTDYVFRVHAIGTTTDEESLPSPTVTGGTTRSECTQGFWKTHPEAWPAACLPLMLGSNLYTASQLQDIFDTPAAGNGLIFLAHQLIAAKFNQCNGSDTSPLGTAIADADALIGSLLIPPVGSGYLAPSTASALTELLDDYNNGFLGGVADCPVPNAPATSWGDMKARFDR